MAGALLTGPVDRDLLERAAYDVALVHEILRTSYRNVLGENSSTLMVIEDEPRIRVVERTGDEATLSTIVQREMRLPAGDDDPLLSLTLVTHADDRRSLVLSAARMSMDAASVEVFVRDLQQAYAARLTGSRWERDDIVQYADYVQWQIEEATSGGQQSEVAARTAKLSGLPPLRLPLELRSGEDRYEEIEWTVPAPVDRELRRLGAGLAGGLRSVLLTGWIAALWHATGRPEGLAVDAVFTRRPIAELTGSIGSFETVLPIIIETMSDLTLADLVRSVDADVDALERADEGAIASPRQPAGGLPGFRFVETADLTATGAPTLSQLWIESADGVRKVALLAHATGEGIRLRLRHQAGAMADGGAEALLGCLQAVLSAMADELSAPVRSTALLSEEASRDLVAVTNAARPPTGPLPHWHRQVERTAQRSPDARALRSDDRCWSYRELDETANRLANELIERGVTAGSLVGLCLERSDVAIVSMLAIAKAGAGYVPVDPNLPPKRRSAIIDAVGFTHVVATAETAADLPGRNVALVDADFSLCARRSSERPATVTADDDPAYVLFTSGSTGTPKGVVVGHGQLASYLDGVLDRLGLAGGIDSVALSTLGTDLGNTALFPPLLTGGELRVVAPEVSADAQALSELLVRESYDLLKITPSHLEAVFAVTEAQEELMPRQALVVGGEPIGWGTYELFRRFLGDCRLFNHYGPSETTVGVLCGRVTSSDLSGLASTVPLGTPMRHARAYVLDPERRPLPVGVPGELWIGGSSVALGYLAGTAPDEERFVADPFSPDPRGRMYRTGDRARLLPDHSFEFLGRLDRQIKIRGFRVELGEIEAVMRSHPRVTGSVAVVAGESTAAHIVGYVIDVEGGRGSADWLREFLTERLPEFMLPLHLVALDAFPLTSTGKINAKMLPEPGAYSDNSTPYVEPRTPTQKKVADIMADLLLLKAAGADDDFFTIGGHSLLATQLVARLRDEFKVNLKLRNLFERPVVSELADFIDELLEKSGGR